MIVDLPLTAIVPSPYQHRRSFNQAKLAELGRSIKTDGLIQPITVRPVGDGYELIAGERRWRAAQLIETPTIMARVIHATDNQARRLCAAENLQRDDLSSVEQAAAIVDLVDAELSDDAEYYGFAATPVERVKCLLGRLYAVHVNRERGSKVSDEGEHLVYKFVNRVVGIFDGLPRPVEWRSFYVHDLPLVTSLDKAVMEWAIEKKLNKSQAKALNEVCKASPAKFAEIVEKGVAALPSEDGTPTPVEDLSSRELMAIARDEKAKAEMPVVRLIEVEPPPLPTVKAGEWWQLGGHLLYCGDTSQPAFTDHVPGAAFAFADPPYNAGVAEWDEGFVWQHDWLIGKAPIVAVTPGIVSIPDFHRKTAMRYVWSLACWVDNGMTRGALGFGNWIYVGLFAREGVSVYRKEQDFVRASINGADNDATKHKGRKPTELMTELFEMFSQKGETVIDPFLGSGTTLLVADQMGRRCVGGEISPAYCTEIVARWEAATKQKARRQSA